MEAAVVEFAEGLPPHKIGVLTAGWWSSAHGQLAHAVPRLLQVAVRPPLFVGRRMGQCAQLQLRVKRGHQLEELRQLVGAGSEVVDMLARLVGIDVHAVREPQPQLICRHLLPDLQRLGGRGGCARPA